MNEPDQTKHIAESICGDVRAALRLIWLDFLLCSQPVVMTLDNLAELLQIPLNTLRADLHRSPEAMPPRLYLPGRRMVRFLRADVAAWLLACTLNGGMGEDAANGAAAN